MRSRLDVRDDDDDEDDDADEDETIRVEDSFLVGRMLWAIRNWTIQTARKRTSSVGRLCLCAALLIQTAVFTWVLTYAHLAVVNPLTQLDSMYRFNAAVISGFCRASAVAADNDFVFGGIDEDTEKAEECLSKLDVSILRLELTNYSALKQIANSSRALGPRRRGLNGIRGSATADRPDDHDDGGGGGGGNFLEDEHAPSDSSDSRFRFPVFWNSFRRISSWLLLPSPSSVLYRSLDLKNASVKLSEFVLRQLEMVFPKPVYEISANEELLRLPPELRTRMPIKTFTVSLSADDYLLFGPLLLRSLHEWLLGWDTYILNALPLHYLHPRNRHRRIKAATPHATGAHTDSISGMSPVIPSDGDKLPTSAARSVGVSSPVRLFARRLAKYSRRETDYGDRGHRGADEAQSGTATATATDKTVQRRRATSTTDVEPWPGSIGTPPHSANGKLGTACDTERGTAADGSSRLNEDEVSGDGSRRSGKAAAAGRAVLDGFNDFVAGGLVTGRSTETLSLAPVMQMHEAARGGVLSWLVVKGGWTIAIVGVYFLAASAFGMLFRHMAVWIFKIGRMVTEINKQNKKALEGKGMGGELPGGHLAKLNHFATHEALEACLFLPALIGTSWFMMSVGGYHTRYLHPYLIIFAFAQCYCDVFVQSEESRHILPRFMLLVHSGSFLYLAFYPLGYTRLLLSILLSLTMFAVVATFHFFELRLPTVQEPPFRVMIRAAVQPAVPLFADSDAAAAAFARKLNVRQSRNKSRNRRRRRSGCRFPSSSSPIDESRKAVSRRLSSSQLEIPNGEVSKRGMMYQDGVADQRDTRESMFGRSGTTRHPSADGRGPFVNLEKMKMSNRIVENMGDKASMRTTAAARSRPSDSGDVLHDECDGDDGLRKGRQGRHRLLRRRRRGGERQYSIEERGLRSGSWSEITTTQTALESIQVTEEDGDDDFWSWRDIESDRWTAGPTCWARPFCRWHHRRRRGRARGLREWPPVKRRREVENDIPTQQTLTARVVVWKREPGLPSTQMRTFFGHHKHWGGADVCVAPDTSNMQRPPEKQKWATDRKSRRRGRRSAAVKGSQQARITTEGQFGLEKNNLIFGETTTTTTTGESGEDEFQSLATTGHKPTLLSNRHSPRRRRRRCCYWHRRGTCRRLARPCPESQRPLPSSPSVSSSALSPAALESSDAEGVQSNMTTCWSRGWFYSRRTVAARRRVLRHAACAVAGEKTRSDYDRLVAAAVGGSLHVHGVGPRGERRGQPQRRNGKTRRRGWYDSYDEQDVSELWEMNAPRHRRSATLPRRRRRLEPRTELLRRGAYDGGSLNSRYTYTASGGSSWDDDVDDVARRSQVNNRNDNRGLRSSGHPRSEHLPSDVKKLLGRRGVRGPRGGTVSKEARMMALAQLEVANHKSLAAFVGSGMMAEVLVRMASEGRDLAVCELVAHLTGRMEHNAERRREESRQLARARGYAEPEDVRAALHNGVHFVLRKVQRLAWALMPHMLAVSLRRRWQDRVSDSATTKRTEES